MSVGISAPNRLMRYQAAQAGHLAAAPAAPVALPVQPGIPAFLASSSSAQGLSPSGGILAQPSALAGAAVWPVLWLPVQAVPSQPLSALPVVEATPALPAAPDLAQPPAAMAWPAPVVPQGQAQGPGPAWWGGQVSEALQQVSAQAWAYLQGLVKANPQPNNPPAAVPPRPSGGKAASFVMSSFNILGSSHTAKGGKDAHMASGPERMNGVLQILREQRVELVGFQEMQKDQAERFLKLAGDDYALYPGIQKGKLPTHNSMAWRKDTFAMVSATTMEVPYFHGKPAKMPVVRLRHKQSGREFYIINVHNPASTKNVGDQERFRDRAEAMEVAMIKRLQAQTGLPVFIVGDMNERDDAYRAFVGGAQMRSSDQGAKGQAPKRMNIDWIFGTKEVRFSQHQRIDGGLVDRTTDHPVIVSRATLS